MSEEPTVSVGNETIEVSMMIDGERKRKRYSGHTKEEAVSAFKEEFMSDLNKSFDIGWSVLKNFIGPREKVEEGKRMVEGNKVLYGQRKWDNFIAAEIQGYLDDEGNERDASDAYHKYKKNFPDIDMRYRHDQEMSSKPKPYTWATSSGGEPYPQSARLEAARRERRIHDAKLQRERQMKRNGGRPLE